MGPTHDLNLRDGFSAGTRNVRSAADMSEPLFPSVNVSPSNSVINLEMKSLIIVCHQGGSARFPIRGPQLARRRWLVVRAEERDSPEGPKQVSEGPKKVSEAREGPEDRDLFVPVVVSAPSSHGTLHFWTDKSSIVLNRSFSQL